MSTARIPFCKPGTIILWLMIALVLPPTIGKAGSAYAKAPDILIDAGHGGVDAGSVQGAIFEKQINLQVSLLLRRQLEKSGEKVAFTRNRDYALSDDFRDYSFTRHRRDLMQRTRIAASLSPRIMLSIHANWSPDAEPHGPLVLYQRNSQSRRLAAAIQHSLNNALHTPGREPRWGRDFYLLDHVACPTVIVEMGYLSNPADRSMLIQPANQRRLAEAVADAVMQYLRNSG